MRAQSWWAWFLIELFGFLAFKIFSDNDFYFYFKDRFNDFKFEPSTYNAYLLSFYIVATWTFNRNIAVFRYLFMFFCAVEPI